MFNDSGTIEWRRLTELHYVLLLIPSAGCEVEIRKSRNTVLQPLRGNQGYRTVVICLS